MKEQQLNELLFQALETGTNNSANLHDGAPVCDDEDLKEEWEEYLEQTQNHVKIVQDTMAKLELDPGTKTPGVRWFTISAHRWLKLWKWLWPLVTLRQPSW